MVLQGVLQILVCFVVVNRGDVVVNCVVNRGVLCGVFRDRKICHFFEIYFRVSHFGNGVRASAPTQFVRRLHGLNHVGPGGMG